jgi:CRISPR-associated endonuclease/helicase Cas3
MRERLQCPVLAYHSRFRLLDRQQAHQRTITAFQTGDGPVLAVTTQVCEMSLDLDADILVTEDAPISSLVQRFGRANRHLRRGDEFRALLVTYPTESTLPYDESDIEAARTFLGALPAEPSQRDLSTLLERLAPRARDAPSDTSRFFGGGYFATPGDFRDADAIGVAAVLDSDVDAVVSASRAKRPIDGYVLQVPRRHALPSSRPLPPWLSIAPADHYDPQLGFLDEGV